MGSVAPAPGEGLDCPQHGNHRDKTDRDGDVPRGSLWGRLRLGNGIDPHVEICLCDGLLLRLHNGEAFSPPAGTAQGKLDARHRESGRQARGSTAGQGAAECVHHLFACECQRGVYTRKVRAASCE